MRVAGSTPNGCLFVQCVRARTRRHDCEDGVCGCVWITVSVRASVCNSEGCHTLTARTSSKQAKQPLGQQNRGSLHTRSFFTLVSCRRDGSSSSTECPGQQLVFTFSIVKSCIVCHRPKVLITRHISGSHLNSFLYLFVYLSFSAKSWAKTLWFRSSARP